MKASDFELVPEDLLDAVIVYGDWLVDRGFAPDIEPYDLEYPNVPVFRVIQQQATSFYEISSTVNVGQAEDWANYGHASSNETRYIVVVANDEPIKPSDLAKLADLGIGVDVISNSKVTTMHPSRDLSLTVEFPVLPKELRLRLGKARDLFEQGNWQESFEDACGVLADDARDYLANAIDTRHPLFIDENNRTKTYSRSAVQRMTLGHLAKAFDELAQSSKMERRVAQALVRINPGRVTTAHYKHDSGNRVTTLREQFGKDLIVIVNAMKMLNGC